MNEIRKTFGEARKGAAGASIVLVILLLIGIYWFRVSSSWNYLPVLISVLTLLAFVSLLHYSGWLGKSENYLKAYTLVLLVSGLFFVLAIPPMASPDEGHHFFASYWLSDLLTGDTTLDSEDGFPVRSDVIELYEESGTLIGSSGYRSVIENFEVLSTNKDVSIVADRAYNIGSENVFARIPSVFAILISRLFCLGAYPLFYLGRIFSVLFFVACASYAVRITPVAKAAFIGASLLPMTLQQAASYSYDCGIIAFTFLLTAVLLRAVFSTEKLRKNEVIAIAVLAIIVAPLKVVYAPVILLVLFIPSRRFESNRIALQFKIGVIILALLSVLALRAVSVISLVGTGASGSLDFRGNESGHFYSLADLALSPLSTASLLFRTVDAMGDFYWQSMIGGFPGWLQGNLKAPDFFLCLYLFFLVASVQESVDDKLHVSGKFRLASIAVFALMFFGVVASMALGWTFNTESIIQGVQGRYFLPLLPLALIAVRSRDVFVKKNSLDLCLFNISVLNAIYVMRFVAIAFSLS